MICHLGIDPVTKLKITIFAIFNKKFYLLMRNPKTLYCHYYKGNGKWIYRYRLTAKVYSTKKEAKIDYENYLNFLKECGYGI